MIFAGQCQTNRRNESLPRTRLRPTSSWIQPNSPSLLLLDVALGRNVVLSSWNRRTRRRMGSDLQLLGREAKPATPSRRCLQRRVRMGTSHSSWQLASPASCGFERDRGARREPQHHVQSIGTVAILDSAEADVPQQWLRSLGGQHAHRRLACTTIQPNTKSSG